MGRANGPLKEVAMATVSSVLADLVSLRVASVDRLAIAGYIPKLSYEGGLVKFLLHRAAQAHYEINIPSPALLGHNHDRMVAELERFVARRDLPVLRFKRGDVKELIARPYQLAAAAAGRDGFVLLGKAQERQLAWAGYKDENSKLSIARHPHFSFSRQARVPDQWYFYLWDHQWGPAFIKLSAYAPYPLWLAANGHEWAKRQLVAAGVGIAELDNGLWRVEDPEAAHRVCARLSAGHIGDLIARWLPELPSPLTSADRAAGFDWAFSIRQMEISDTAVFDRPQVGRAWFEAAIKDHLDLGRPDKVRLVFDRRVQLKGTKSHQTPGRFSTQVVTRGVHPRIEARYKSSQVKAYFKQQRALRVETTINNPRDFGVNKTLNTSNWRASRHIGAGVNARFLQALSEGNGTVPDGQLLADVVLPSVHDGQRAPGLRFGEPRVAALLEALCSIEHLFDGLTNATLRAQVSALLGVDYRANQATYDLRRLRLKGLIERIAHTNRYRVTEYRRRVATFFTRLSKRVAVPALAALTAPRLRRRATPPPLTAAWRDYDRQVQQLLKRSGIAA
jgi:hypothetical protein